MLPIPIRDIHVRSRFPAVTLGIIILNVLVFLFQSTRGDDSYRAERFVYQFSLVPKDVDVLFEYGPSRYAIEIPSSEPFAPPLRLTRSVTFWSLCLSFFSCQFLHASISHILGNMWFLWIFGDNIEERLGRARYLVFYLLCGVLAGVAHVATNPGSTLPTVGASGAISGILGAYLLRFPRNRILCVVPLWPFLLYRLELPAVLFLGGWFVLQILTGSLAPAGPEVGGVAIWAHVGGFLSGLFLLPLFHPREDE